MNGFIVFFGAIILFCVIYFVFFYQPTPGTAGGSDGGSDMVTFTSINGGNVNNKGCPPVGKGSWCKSHLTDCASQNCGAGRIRSKSEVTDSGCVLSHRDMCQDVLTGLCDGTTTIPAIPYGIVPKDVGLGKPIESETPIVKSCKYDKRDFKTIDQLRFAKKFGLAGGGKRDQVLVDGDLDKIYGHVCGLPRESWRSCKTDLITGKEYKTCSNYSATGDAGELCTDWLVNVQNQNDPTLNSLADAGMRIYCTENPTCETCSCLNRNRNKTYRELSNSGFKETPDQCWWRPCKNDDVLRTTDLLDDSVCPKNICQTILNILDTGGDVDISDLQQNIDCDFSGYEKCAATQYRPKSADVNKIEACMDCTVCKSDEVELKPCTPDTNSTCGSTKCEDKSQYSPGDGKPCEPCRKCGEGEYVKTPCHDGNDTECAVTPTSCKEDEYTKIKDDYTTCTRCTVCDKTESPCTVDSDTVCAPTSCKQGEYTKIKGDYTTCTSCRYCDKVKTLCTVDSDTVCVKEETKKKWLLPLICIIFVIGIVYVLYFVI